MAEQCDGVQSLRVDGPDPEIGLQTPESMVDRSVRVRRKLSTPPLIDPRGVSKSMSVGPWINDGHRKPFDDIWVVHKTMIAILLFHSGSAKPVLNNGSRHEWS